jgi:iron complex outermembrane receptor protein
VLGLTWHVTDQWNIYANQGKGFETPTLSEAAYTSNGTNIISTFNPLLKAATSTHQELGTKWSPSASTQLVTAWFHIGTNNEIVSEVNKGGKTSYSNASRTVREGWELNIRHQWDRNWKAVGSLTAMRAVYDQSFTTTISNIPVTYPAGNRLPGIPQQQAFASLQWSQSGFGLPGKMPPQGLEAALDWMARSRLWANDSNTEYASGFGILNARFKQRFMPMERMFMEAYLGIDNLANRLSVGSVIVNQLSLQFYEPGLPRSWVVGLQTRLAL